LIDTTNDAKNAFLILTKNYNGDKIRKIVIRNGYLKIKPAVHRALFLSGSFNSTVELKSINRLPSLQKQYVQGRSINGSLAWLGPETNDLFSFGPAANILEFDGSNYVFDLNGKLVPHGSGNGQKANIYKSNIFRTASLLSNSLMLQSRYTPGRQQYFTKITLGQSTENTFIKSNKNASQNLSASLEGILKRFKVSSTYSTVRETFSNSNRNGFLNRVYQNSILTPISFDNSQGNTIGNNQRSYSQEADNPYFLLNDNGNSFSESHTSGSLVIENQFDQLKVKVVQSAERLRENTTEGYKSGTAFFPNGIHCDRRKTDGNYFLNPSISYDIEFDNYRLRSNIFASYIYGNSHSAIVYNTAAYKYQRSSNDLLFNYLASYDAYGFETGIKAENKFYTSNTCSTRDYFLPGGSAYFRVKEIFYGSDLGFKLTSTFNNFNGELPISNSFSQITLTRYTPEQALQYLPVTEIQSFDDLLPIQHKEWSARTELNYKYRILFEAEIFDCKILDDIFPVFENGIYNLKNIFNHRNRGFELELTYNSNSRNVTTTNSASFFSYKDVVTDVKAGFDFTPIAGFTSINKAVVKGNALGCITGTSFLKDNSGNILIGDDGFPLVNTTHSVIGNATPDFIIKMSNNITWKKFSISLDWEWKKGGDVWNGTQAILD
jgi:hypothetical protein